MARSTIGVVLCLILAIPAWAQPPVLPPGDKEPVLRLEAGGPTSFVTALAFSPDGKTLYAAGWDKVVRLWVLDEKKGEFGLDRVSYRVPLGPGLDGAINAMALSDDGVWLAAAGLGVIRGGAGFRQPGALYPVVGGLTPEMRLDRGLICVFNTRTQEARLLRGHAGVILTMAFAPSYDGKPPLLVATARERDAGSEKYLGTVRLWDVDKGAEIARRLDLPDPLDARRGSLNKPGLAAWHTGAQLRQMRVGLAWGDGKFRVWNVAQDRADSMEVEDGLYNTSAVYLASQKLVLTASRQPAAGGMEGSGQVRGWLVSGNEAPEASRRVAFPLADRSHFFPRALTLLASQGDGKLDHAAVALRRLTDGKEEDRLQLIRLDERGFKTLAGDVPLWQSSGDLPVLAGSARGRYLAVAGNAEHTILLYRLADLLANKVEPVQRLRGVGETFRYAAFVLKGKDLGLIVSDNPVTRGAAPRGPQAKDLIFELSQRILSADLKGWELFSPELAGWRAELEAEDGKIKRPLVLVVQRQQEKPARIVLKPNQEVTGWAVLPVLPPLQVPLVAVAYHERGEPVLALYDARTAEQVRQLTGHQDYIRSLAFSRDGKLLVSAADDQTVCVWSLAHLEKVLGQLGLLRGVAVDAGEKGGLVVASVDAETLAPGNKDKLAKGDVIEGLVENNKLRPLATPREFYDALMVVKPGSKVSVRVRTDGKQRDVVLVVGQAIDERKPLFTLFVTRGPRLEDRDWIGWNPIGPYDSSGPRAERYLGWHRNTGDPKAPATFALADQYRKEYYRRGILKHLVARASLTPALESWKEENKPKGPPRPPNVGLQLDDGGAEGPRKVQGRVLIQKRQVTLKAAVTGLSDFDEVASIRWQLDNGPVRDFPPAPGLRYQANLDLANLPPGPHRLRVALTLRTDGEPRQYTEELAIQFQAPPPVINWGLLDRLATSKQVLAVNAVVQPGEPGGKPLVRVLHRHNDREVANMTPKGLEVGQTLELRPGENQIEIMAVNADPLRGHEDWETARQVRRVFYQVKAQPPIINLSRVLPGRPEESLPIEPGQPVVVHVATVRLEGEIQSIDNLTRAEWARNDDKPRSLAMFESGRPFKWAGEAIELQPGPQKVRVQARTATSDEAEAVVTIDYRPALPKLTLSAALPDPEGVLYEGQDPPRILLEGRLEFPRDRRAFRAAVLVNDQERKDVQPEIDLKAGTLSARVPLNLGPSLIQVRLTNEWGAASTIPLDPEINYLRPPRIVQVVEPKVGDRPVVDVVAWVESASELREATVNGRELPAKSWQFDEQRKQYQVIARDVPLERGANTIEVRASNADGACLQPGVLKLAFAPAPPPRAVVEILRPRRDLAVEEPLFPIEFRVRSASPLRRVELLRGRQVVFPANAAAAAKNAEGLFELKTIQEVRLEPGVNPFQVVAINDGGETVESVNVSLTYVPVRIRIDRVVCKDQPGDVQFQVRENNRIVFPDAAAGSKLVLHGRILWTDAKDRRLDEARAVRVWVNGFQQMAAELAPRATKELTRSFEASVVLNRPSDNQVEIELPNLAQESSNRPVFALDCRKPEERQRLHVLIVSIAEEDEGRIKDRVLAALGARSTHYNEFTTGAFSQGRIYGPLLSGEVSPRKMAYQIAEIRHRIELLSRREATNDVLLVYYHGGESMTESSPLLWTSTDRKRRQAVINRTDLALIGETPGAHLMMLDVAREGSLSGPSARGPSWFGDTYAGILRYAWPDQGVAPLDTGLIQALQSALPYINRLKDVAERLSDQHAEMVRKYPKLQYESQLPRLLEDLIISRKP